MNNNLSEIQRHASGVEKYYQGYVDYLHSLLQQIDAGEMARVVKTFLDARENGKTIFFVGNGGSAATASHFAQDIAEVGRKANAPGFKTLSLTDNVSFITAAGNDYGYETIFTTQMKYIFSNGDVLVAISASGNSLNVIKAAQMARERGGTTIALVGFEGGDLSRISDHVLHLRTPKGEYGPVEDAHMIFVHIIASYLIAKVQDEQN